MRKATVRLIGPWRPATPEDLVAALGPARRSISQPSALRESHHRVARMLAAGLRTGEITDRTGYSPNRIAQLAGTPAMRDLVAKYRDLADESYSRELDEYHASLFRTRAKANLQIENQLDEAESSGASLPLRDLLAIRADADDRVGFSKRDARLNVNADFAAELERAIARSRNVTPQEAAE